MLKKTYGTLRTPSYSYKLLNPVSLDVYPNGVEMFLVCDDTGGQKRMVAVRQYDIDLIDYGLMLDVQEEVCEEELIMRKLELNSIISRT